jgi:hypothetical protein
MVVVDVVVDVKWWVVEGGCGDGGGSAAPGAAATVSCRSW